MRIIMTTKTQQLETFINKIEMRLILKARKSKKKSKHTGQPCIKVPDELAFNLVGSRWLDELVNDSILDNQGYSYCYSVLTPHQLCELADNL
jgi:hypothetical protein